MADLSPIQTYLDQIKNAIYGEEVRSAIHDSIARCYTDVDDSKTIAASAADEATTAATSASAAASDANRAKTNAQAAADAANSAATNATNEAASARTATTNANTAISNANTARDRAASAATSATNAASSANTAATAANRAATNADTATTSANNAATNAIDAANAATGAAADARTAIDDCNTARYATITAAQSADTAASRANSASSMIENISVSSENVSPDTQASVHISDVDGHKHLHFRLRQGATGAAYLIKGHAYATLSELESDITSPAVGDQYNVGSAAPYHIYRWTGSTWEDQGQIGINFENLTETEIDSIWNGSAVSSGQSKYIDHTGLFHLIINRIKASLSTKVDKVDGKGLSTNDFTDKYINQINTHTNQIASLSTVKVDKVTGKGLSTNDFTNEYRNLINRVNSFVGSFNLETDAKNVSGAINELYETIQANRPLRIKKSTFSSLPLTINSSVIKEEMVVAECVFGTPSAITSDVTWTTANGSLTLNGTMAANTNTSADILLIPMENIREYNYD